MFCTFRGLRFRERCGPKGVVGHSYVFNFGVQGLGRLGLRDIIPEP